MISHVSGAAHTAPQSTPGDDDADQQNRNRPSDVYVVAPRVAPPRPRVRLFTDDVVVHRVEGLTSRYETISLPLLALSFDYGGVIVRADAPSEDDFDVDLDDDLGIELPACLRTPHVHVDRDRAAEIRARRVLESFGAVELSCLDDYAVAPGVDADYVVRCEGSVHELCGFTADTVPRLRALGFQVEVAGDHRFRTLSPEPGWYATLSPLADDDDDEDGKPDWFSLQLGIDLDGRRIDLLPALVELLERMSEGQALRDLERRMPKVLAVPVEDGLYLALPRERMATLLRIVAELYDGRKNQELFKVGAGRAAALVALDGVFEAAGASLQWTGGEAIRARGAAIASVPPPVAAPPGLRAQLRPYQEEGLAWLQKMRALGAGAILADDMGLGKTLQTIAHLAVEKAQGRLTEPALIVAPTSLVPNWEREIGKFAPHLRVVVLHGARRAERFTEVAGADVVITSYPLVCRDEEQFADWSFHLVILDEAQTIKNTKSTVHGAMRNVRATHRLCLTGTPVENHLGELWALMDFLNPGLLGDEVGFGRFYRVPIEKARSEERLAALRDLLAPYILRRTKSEVVKELPAKTEVLRPVELSGPQRELYESIRVAAHAEVRRLIRKKGLAASTVPILGALTKLRQVCCDPRLLGGTYRKDAVASAKYQAFEQLMAGLLAEGRRVLVFSQFTTMLDLIARGLDQKRIRYALLTGDTEDRAAEVDSFQSNRGDKDQPNVFLLSLRAGGTGLTLTRADAVIHYDPWWNPAVQAQATDRAHRIGQQNQVTAYNLYVAGSVEERMLRLQKRKRSVADAILGNGAASAALTEDDVEVLFAPLGLSGSVQ